MAYQLRNCCGRRDLARCLIIVILVLVLLGVVGTADMPDAAAGGSAPRTTAATPLPASDTSYVFTLRFNGQTRNYRLHVPPAASTGKPLPLVLNLHGYTWNASGQEIYTQMDTTADQDGFLVAYPHGTKADANDPPHPSILNAQYSWNAGACCGLPVTKHVDSVGFLLRVINNIAARTPVDLRRVYVTGMSAGGMMAYTMAAKAPGHIAAIASVSGQVELPAIHPSRPVPTMEFHSVNDPIAKWGGTPGATPKYSVMEGINQWVKADGCRATPHTGKTIVGTPGSPSVGESATPITYTGCRAGTEVVLWKFTGSGHVWPGSTLNTGPKSSWYLTGSGQGTTLVNADQVMWQFFQRYQLPSAPPLPRGR